MLIFLCILFTLALCGAESSDRPNCTFSWECTQFGEVEPRCIHGGCYTEHRVLSASDRPCNSTSECDCQDSKDCYCLYNRCLKEKLECHETEDCKKMKKCEGKTCHCVANVCEHECEEAEDCESRKLMCSEDMGNKCKCEENLCEIVKPPCDDMEDCIKNGECEEHTPCACAENVCIQPYPRPHWMLSSNLDKFCQISEDCNRMIFKCLDGKCSCKKHIIIEGEKWGTCVVEKKKKSV